MTSQNYTERAAYAKKWLSSAAPEKYRFANKRHFQKVLQQLLGVQKKALGAIAAILEKHPTAVELHEGMHALKDTLEISPKDLFSAVYTIFLNKKEGPKAGWFLHTLDREFALKRLKEAAAA